VRSAQEPAAESRKLKRPHRCAKLAELLCGGYFSPVYHGEHWRQAVKKLSRSYLVISGDLVLCDSSARL
jgi:hypothetical protein